MPADLVSAGFFLHCFFVLRCVALLLALTQQITVRTVYSFDIHGMPAAQSALTFHSPIFKKGPPMPRQAATNLHIA
jgi:hypothetical protein